MTYEGAFWILFIVFAAVNIARLFSDRARAKSDREVAKRLRDAAAALRNPAIAANKIEVSLHRSMALGYDLAAEQIERHIVYREPLAENRLPPFEQSMPLQAHGRGLGAGSVRTDFGTTGDR
jgi:hypothetical protein